MSNALVDDLARVMAPLAIDPTVEWRRQLQQLLADRIEADARLAQCIEACPMDDPQAWLAWRRDAGLDGPATADDIIKAVDHLMRQVDRSSDAMRFELRRLFESGEAHLLHSARSGTSDIVFALREIPYSGVRSPGQESVITVRRDVLPFDHPLARSLTPAGCWLGTMIILPAGAVDDLTGRRLPRRWYTTVEVVALTRRWREIELSEERERREEMEAKRRQEDEQVRRQREADSGFLKRQLADVQRELAELKRPK
jgi:hypothetical protein